MYNKAYADGRVKGAAGVPITLSATGLWLSIPSLNTWVATSDTAALVNGLFGGNDTFNGTAFADAIIGYGGDDTMNAGDGADNVFGGIGNDTLNGDSGEEHLSGGIGNDIIQWRRWKRRSGGRRRQ